ncbi:MULTISPECIES: hypothetical protein [unclassified Micromonospora]|uniref:hypothetical protein n=1 Tax=unclassified Micromonospora TaxID=2617518 RepID=UPI0036412302
MESFNAEAVANDVRASGLLAQDDEALLDALRKRGFSVIQSAIVFAKTRRVSLSEAKDVIADSEVWSTAFAVSASIQDEIEESFRE